MESGNGSQELSRLASAHIVSVAFGLTFLLASLHGVDGTTSLLRGVTAGGLALVIGRPLCAPVIDVVLTAMARDEAKKAGVKPTEDDA
jgi:hypothetical protein